MTIESTEITEDSELPAMEIRLKIDEDGGVVIPVKLRQRIGIEPGGDILFVYDKKSLQIKCAPVIEQAGDSHAM